MESHTKIFLFTVLDMRDKRLESLKINSVNLLYLIFDKVNGYCDKINVSKYLMLVPTNETRENKKIYMKNCGGKSEI